MKIILSLVLFLFSIGAKASPCANWAGTRMDKNIYDKFEDELVQFLNGKKFAQIGKLSRYPVKVRADGHRVELRSEKAFGEYAPKIFTAAFVAKLLEHNKENTVCNSQGVGWTYGALWIAGTEPKIIAINN